MHLSLPVAGLGHGLRVGAAGASPLGSSRLSERALPVALQLHDLGAVDQAPAAEGDQVRLPLAPLRQNRRPFPGPADLERRLTGEDHAAVDDAGDDRRQLAGRSREHRLVEQPEALARPPRLDQDVPLRVRSEAEQVAVAEALAIAAASPRLRRRLELALGFELEHARQQQVAAFGAFAPELLEQPLCTGQPAASPGDLAPLRAVKADPDRAAKRCLELIGAAVRCVRALEEGQRLVRVAEHVRDRRQELDIRAGELELPIRRRERRLRGAPTLLGV